MAARQPFDLRLIGLLRQCDSGALPQGRVLRGGRGRVQAFDLGSGLHVVLRPYQRGGFVRQFNRNVYFGFTPRPFRELNVTEYLRQRGVPVAEVLAAAVRWVFPACYQGVIVTREISGSTNLWEFLTSSGKTERARACQAAAQVTRKLHDAGAVHPDLNLQNFLVCRDGDDLKVWIVDLDRAQLRSVTPVDRKAAFDRICRSIRRLDPTSEFVTLACVEAFHTIAVG